MKSENFTCLKVKHQQINLASFVTGQIFKEIKWNIQRLNLKCFTNYKNAFGIVYHSTGIDSLMGARETFDAFLLLANS
jgi:hypothetical protein